jgi:hypothetical protein
MNCYKMIHLMLSLTPVLLLHTSVLRLDSRTLLLFQLDPWTPSRLVYPPLFRLVPWLKTLWILIDLLMWIIFHMFLFYPNGIPRKLNILEMMLEMHPLDENLEIKTSIPTFPWWLVCLKTMIMFPTQMLKDDLNGRKLCKNKFTLFWRVILRTWFPNYKEIIL